MKDDEKGHVVLDFCFGEKAATPRFDPPTGEQKLVVEDVVRVRVLGRLLPRLFDHLKKTWHVHPKFFTPKNIRLLGSTTTSEEQ